MAAPLELHRQILSPELLERLGKSGKELATEFAAPRPDPTERRSFRRRRWRQAAIVAVALALVAARWQATGTPSGGDLPEGRYEVAAVMSADTIQLANHVEVRLLGVASAMRGSLSRGEKPAVAARAAAALDFTRRFVAGGEVRLQFDRARLDSAGRYLAYVWLDGPGGSRLLNEELLRAGLVEPDRQTLTLCSSSMKRRLSQAADAAAHSSPKR